MEKNNPTKKKNLHIRLTEADYQDFESLALIDNRSKAQLAEMIITRYIKSRKI